MPRLLHLLWFSFVYLFTYLLIDWCSMCIVLYMCDICVPSCVHAYMGMPVCVCVGQGPVLGVFPWWVYRILFFLFEAGSLSMPETLPLASLATTELSWASVSCHFVLESHVGHHAWLKIILDLFVYFVHMCFSCMWTRRVSDAQGDKRGH